MYWLQLFPSDFDSRVKLLKILAYPEDFHVFIDLGLQEGNFLVPLSVSAEVIDSVLYIIHTNFYHMLALS